METIRDFEDLLSEFEDKRVRYLIIGGLAFIYHAKPRYTKDMDLWIDPDPSNIDKANEALAEFGSPFFLSSGKKEEILQIGLPPDRIDLLQDTIGIGFDAAWKNRIRAQYGDVVANWINLEDLIQIKSMIDHPRHQEDVRVLKEVKKRKQQQKK